MIRARIAVLVFCAWLAPEASAQPAASVTPQQAVALQGQVCAAVCRRRFRDCAGGSPGGGAVSCDSDFVVCTAGCPKCVGVFDQCVTAKDKAKDAASPRACQVPFVACMRAALAAPAADRPVIRFEGGDGTSQKAAVVIVGARNEREGIVAELLWAMKTHPDWTKSDQALLNIGGRSFDRIGYTTPSGPREAWFDITGFFGKM